MHLDAQHIHLIPDQRVHFTCPPLMEEAYRTFIRVAIVLVIAPISLIVFTCLFHVPFIPVVVMFVIMALLKPLERFFASIALRIVWPLHSRWLMHKRPNAPAFKSTRSVQRVRYHVDIEIDEDTHTLHIQNDPTSPNDHHIPLNALAYTGFERADDVHGSQLRITLRTPNPNTKTISFAVELRDAWLDHPTPNPQRTRYFTIPRKEGDTLVVSPKHFLLLLDELERAHAFHRVHNDLTPDTIRTVLRSAFAPLPEIPTPHPEDHPPTSQALSHAQAPHSATSTP